MLYNEFAELSWREHAPKRRRLGRDQSQPATGYRDNLHFVDVRNSAGMVACAHWFMAKRPCRGDRCLAPGSAAHSSRILSAHGHEPNRAGWSSD